MFNLLQITSGTVDITSLSETAQTIILNSIVQHEEYDPFSLSYDIALLELSSPLTFDSNTQPILLAEDGQFISGSCVASGWGALLDGGESTNILQKVSVPVVPDNICKDAYGETEIYDSMICLGVEGKDSCLGDTGSPLTCQNEDGSSFLGGIYSWGYGCAKPGYPGIYTEVSHFIDWIANNAN